MSTADLMAIAQRLNLSVDALAALGAHLRARTEGIAVPTEVAELLDDVAAALDVDLTDLTDDEMRIVADSIRTYFIQAADLLADPGREPGWTFDDPVLLQSQGRASASVAKLISAIVPTLDGLTDRLQRPDAAMLDVGTGVAELAIEIARTYPAVHIVGIDPWRPALDLARENLAAAGLDDRIELREQRVEELTDRDRFDLVWLAGPFLPPDVTEPALARSARALRSGGWLVMGAYAGPADPLAATLAALRTVRGGGRPLAADESIDLLGAAGFTDVRQIERTWPAPVDFVVGREP